MGKVIVHAVMSLDGFIAGPDDEMEWSFKYGGDAMADEVMQDTGAVVLGKRTFEISLKNNQLPYGGWKVPQFVITGEAQDAQTIGGLVFTFVTDGVQHAVEMARVAAGDKNVSLLGASIDQQCLKAHLVDEIVIHLAPILLGEGTRLFDHLGNQPVVLERTAAVTTAGITSLRFRVVR
jgi:dihydrofolate reductase